ncbi:hypothetical protein [Bordetella sp. FB-8]|uniref:hypothetical protein n=1 Tax=Bordetella sp. FB-8 TaxID=1159870 RepID=UPI0012DE354C|nr:hypothetical protein [Bordetella sp. FB-8]
MEESNITLEFQIEIKNSNVEVICQLEEWRSELWPEIYRRALDLCRAMVDLVGFRKGWGVSVILETRIEPDGEKLSIAQTDDALSKICTAYTLEDGFGKVCAEVIKNPQLFMALRELITAISLPHVSPVECARSMDRLKHLVVKPGTKDGVAWEQFRTTLRIGEDYLRFITDTSKNHRHGHPGYTPGTVTSEVVRRSWVIMNRFFEYLLSGSQTLDPGAFPMIVE